MFVKSLDSVSPIIANDLTELRELLHPETDGLPLGYSLAHAVIRPGQHSIRHHLVGASEVYYLISGEGLMHVNDEARPVRAGDALLIPAGAVQFLENTGQEDLAFLAIVEPAWRPAIDIRDEDPAIESDQCSIDLDVRGSCEIAGTSRKVRTTPPKSA